VGHLVVKEGGVGGFEANQVVENQPHQAVVGLIGR
jgi:hypothetical protein